ncbi:MAG TPA: MerR family transcriptional regulator, partial [Actinomycetota bacterium]|nr:MerR family transcriptional regulator [Actinomycetota bacterium]
MSEQPMPNGPAEREPGYLRIGELARRTGVSPELLRAWERRYGLLRPARTQGGYRLYTAADEARIRRMRAYLARGVAAAEAARLAVDAEAQATSAQTAPDDAETPGQTDASTPAGPPAEAPPPRPPLRAAASDLAGALDRFEEAEAHDVF